MIKFYRSLKIALQYIIRNLGLSFASIIVVALSFFIVSMVGLAFYGTFKLAQHVDSKPPLVVYLRSDLTEEQKNEFHEKVNKTGYVREIETMNQDFSKNDFNQKFPDMDLSTQSEKSFYPILSFIYGDKQEDLEKIINELENDQNFKDNLVDKTNIGRVGWYSFNKNQADVIKDTNRILRTSGLAITLFLFFISSVLIFITVKLTIQYHKKELQIMDLVGADGWFIRLPFIIDGIIYGVLGAVLSTGIITLLKNVVKGGSNTLGPKLNEFFGEVPWPIVDTIMILKVFGIAILVGAIVGAVSSFFAIIKYVKK